MDSSEKGVPIESQTSPAKEEPASPAKPVPSVQPRAPQPVKLSSSGKYHYDGDSETYDTILGRLVPGLNDFSGFTHPEVLEALKEKVEAGLLRPA